MALLSDSDLKHLQETFADLKSPVKLVFFTQALNCETCDVARQVLDEVTRISDKITIEEHNFLLDKDAAAGYGIDRVPAVAVVGQNGDSQARDYGIRFFGAPHGYEFSSLLESILLVGGVEEPGLNETSMGLLASVQEPVHIQVFVTPT
jgi:alkyl hydroperoxide reductase subunit AhpF